MAEYPKGKSMKLPAGRLSMYVPGNGDVTDNREGAHAPTSAWHCAGEMSLVVPGCNIGKVTYKRD